MLKRTLKILAPAALLLLTACAQQQDKSSVSQAPQGQERTLSIIKPDAVEGKHIGEIINRFEKEGLTIVGIRMVKLSKDQAGEFYGVHKDRSFYSELIDFMSSGPVVVMVLEGREAVAKNRRIMGSTDPKEADYGTIRKDYALSKGKNAVHGSDSPESAKEEILFFFKPDEIVSH